MIAVDETFEVEFADEGALGITFETQRMTEMEKLVKDPPIVVTASLCPPPLVVEIPAQGEVLTCVARTGGGGGKPRGAERRHQAWSGAARSANGQDGAVSGLLLP